MHNSSVHVHNFLVLVSYLYCAHDDACMCFTEPLSVDCHLRVVRAAAWEVREKWHSLGVELGIKEGTRNVSVCTVCTLNCSSMCR